MRERIGRALGDTLARRIFILLWVTLVAAQALAIGVVTWVRGDFNVARMPGAPTLPPMPGLMHDPKGQPQQPGPIADLVEQLDQLFDIANFVEQQDQFLSVAHLIQQPDQLLGIAHFVQQDQ